MILQWYLLDSKNVSQFQVSMKIINKAIYLPNKNAFTVYTIHMTA